MMFLYLVSQHILSRWAFPIVPETNLIEGDNYELSRGTIYKDGGVKLSRSCVIKQMVQIGADTIIGEHSRISKSVIGKRCRIGNNVTLEGVFLWDDITIEDNCQITSSILAHGVNIKKDTIIERGCLLSFDVSVMFCMQFLPHLSWCEKRYKLAPVRIFQSIRALAGCCNLRVARLDSKAMMTMSPTKV